MQAADCDDYDDVEFTFLEMDENGLITFDDLSLASYEVMACEIVPDPLVRLACDFDTDYFTVETPSYQIPDFDPGNIYWYGMTGLTTDGCFIAGRARDYWPPVEVPEPEQIPDPTPFPVLLPPENVAFDPGGTTVTWDAVPDAAGYIVEWRQGADDPWTRVETVNTTYDIPNFDTSVPYSVRILTVNSEDVAGPASDIVDWTPPGAPRNLRINNDGSVTWDDDEDADHYLTGWLKNHEGSAQFAAQAGNQMQDQRTETNVYNIPDFNPGSDYNADTRTVNEHNAKSARAFARYNPPPAPDNVVIDEYGEVTWDAVTEATHYLVDWIKGPSPWDRENQVTPASFTISNFDAAADYIVTLRSVNSQNVESFPPVSQSWTPPTVDPPTKLRISRVGFVKWTAADYASRYTANWRLKDGAWSSDISVDADDPLNFTISGFDEELEYEVRVRTDLDVGNTTLSSDFVTQTWPMPDSGDSSGSGRSDDAGSTNPRQLCRVSPHNGSSLIVWYCSYNNYTVEARSGEEGTSLFTGELCSGYTKHKLASSTTVEVWCNASNQYHVIELNPQHPQDARRDILVFDEFLSQCYRAYEYLATGTLEIWHRSCT